MSPIGYVRCMPSLSEYNDKEITLQIGHSSSSVYWQAVRQQSGTVPSSPRDSNVSSVNSRSSFIITFVFMMITAFVLAEICSALPISGSTYIWAAASAGPKYARFFGFLVAWWSSTGWMTSAAAVCQAWHSQNTVVRDLADSRSL